MLVDEGSPLDLMLRGFDRQAVRSRTGFDIGYHGAALRRQAAGIDRHAYKVEHVRQRVAPEVVGAVLQQYAEGLTKAQVLDALGLAGENVVKLKQLFAALGVAAEFKEADTAARKLAMRSGMAAKYGVDNPFKLPQVQEQAASTREAKYGGRYTFSAGSALASRARTTFAEHMRDTDFATQLQESKSATTRERFGVDFPAQSPEVRRRMRETNTLRFGVAYWSQLPASRAGQAQRAREFSVEWATKARNTSLNRYGVAHHSMLPESRSRQSERMRSEFAQRDVKARATHRQRYGVDYPTQRPEYRNNLARFIARNRHSVDEATQATGFARYGVPYYTQTPDFRQEQSQRMLTADHQRRIHAAKTANNSFNTSVPEDELYRLLIDFFGIDDVVRQYRDETRYPFACDFYVPSRDLFVELNGMWTHGGHWFKAGDLRDQRVASRWEAKGTKFYDLALHQWRERDVVKREHARRAGLNYVVFWDGKNLQDARLWLAMGAPDGEDYIREHSWLPRRELNLDGTFPGLDARPRTAIAAARRANWRQFYRRELALWSDDYSPKHGSVTGHLFANRFRYLGKLPDQLSDFEILRGLSIAGILRGWTVFDNTGMVRVLRDHDVTSVYDPCAGWGERMVTAAAFGVGYTGIDINPAAVDGHRRLVHVYAMCDQSTTVGDAATHDMRNGTHEVVFTCPPYGSTEKYTDAGAENLTADQFLAWWERVVRMSVAPTTRVFAYQINQRWKNAMNAVLERAGWCLIQQTPVGAHRVNHFNRSVGAVRKREFEEVQVFKRA